MTGRVYYGTKRVEAAPTFGGDSEVDDGSECVGYRVTYPDGYTSWSPKDVFEAAYRPADRMDFEGALAAMREGRKVRRCTIDAENVSMWLADGKILVQRAGMAIGVWQPNTESLLADWMVVDEPAKATEPVEASEHTGWAG